MKVITPVLEPISKSSLSGPPSIKISFQSGSSLPPSASVKVTVPTDSWFSSTVNTFCDVMTGLLSLVSLIVTVISWGVVLSPLLSVALTVTLYILSVLASAGLSKSGLALSVNAPDAWSTAKLAASAPSVIE